MAHSEHRVTTEQPPCTMTGGMIDCGEARPPVHRNEYFQAQFVLPSKLLNICLSPEELMVFAILSACGGGYEARPMVWAIAHKAMLSVDAVEEILQALQSRELIEIHRCTTCGNMDCEQSFYELRFDTLE